MTEPKKPGRKKTSEKIQARVNLETFDKLKKEDCPAKQIRRIVEAYYSSIAVKTIVETYYGTYRKHHEHL